MTLMLGDTQMKTTLQTCAGVLAAAGASFGSLADPVLDANANAAAAAKSKITGKSFFIECLYENTEHFV